MDKTKGELVAEQIEAVHNLTGGTMAEEFRNCQDNLRVSQEYKNSLIHAMANLTFLLVEVGE